MKVPDLVTTLELVKLSVLFDLAGLRGAFFC